MKHSKLLTTIAMLAACVTASAAGAVEVDFVDSKEFTDFSDSDRVVASTQKAYIGELTKFMEERLGNMIAPGHSLQVVITDVDMAGEFEPWRRGGYDDVRVVKDLYPPRIDLSFRIVDENGNTIREGDRKLRDLGFMHAARRTFDTDPLRHEKELLGSWIRKEFRDSATT